MTTIEMFQAFESTKATVAKLQSDFDAEMAKLEDVKQSLRSALGIDVATPDVPGRSIRKRGPRSLESIVMTACSRKLTEAKALGTKKAAALAAAITQAEGIARERGGMTEELKGALAVRAEEVFSGKK